MNYCQRCVCESRFTEICTNRTTFLITYRKSVTKFGLLIVVDTAHSERYMGMATPSDNLDGYEVNTVFVFLYSYFYNYFLVSAFTVFWWPDVRVLFSCRDIILTRNCHKYQVLWCSAVIIRSTMATSYTSYLHRIVVWWTADWRDAESRIFPQQEVSHRARHSGR